MRKFEKTTTIRIRREDKARLDMLAEFEGKTIIDIVSNAVGIYQLSLIKYFNEKAKKEGA